MTRLRTRFISAPSYYACNFKASQKEKSTIGASWQCKERDRHIGHCCVVEPSLDGYTLLDRFDIDPLFANSFSMGGAEQKIPLEDEKKWEQSLAGHEKFLTIFL